MLVIEDIDALNTAILLSITAVADLEDESSC